MARKFPDGIQVGRLYRKKDVKMTCGGVYYPWVRYVSWMDGRAYGDYVGYYEIHRMDVETNVSQSILTCTYTSFRNWASEEIPIDETMAAYIKNLGC